MSINNQEEEEKVVNISKNEDFKIPLLSAITPKNGIFFKAKVEIP